jgi:hypothetical protein
MRTSRLSLVRRASSGRREASLALLIAELPATGSVSRQRQWSLAGHVRFRPFLRELVSLYDIIDGLRDIGRMITRPLVRNVPTISRKSIAIGCRRTMVATAFSSISRCRWSTLSSVAMTRSASAVSLLSKAVTASAICSLSRRPISDTLPASWCKSVSKARIVWSTMTAPGSQTRLFGPGSRAGSSPSSSQARRITRGSMIWCEPPRGTSVFRCSRCTVTMTGPSCRW